MKTNNQITGISRVLSGGLCLAALALAPILHAQDAPTNPPPDGRPMPPLIVALDSDADGILSAEEIAKASENLLKLDKNNDGKLDMSEIRPPRPNGFGRGQGGRRGFPGPPHGFDGPDGPPDGPSRED